MATRRYSLNKGDNEYQVTEAAGAAVVTKEMEFTVDLATVTDVAGGKEAVLLALDNFINYIQRGNWPPA
jgi:hypothetical protein